VIAYNDPQSSNRRRDSSRFRARALGLELVAGNLGERLFGTQVPLDQASVGTGLVFHDTSGS
jgi:hypothetical protein